MLEMSKKESRAHPDGEKDNPQRVWVTRAAGEGWSRVEILQPAPVPATTRTRDPCRLANP